MKVARIVFALSVAALSIAACSAPQQGAGLEAKLKEATAEAVPGVLPENVVIANQMSTAATVQWRAAVGGKTYDCNADNMARLPDCQQVS